MLWKSAHILFPFIGFLLHEREEKYVPTCHAVVKRNTTYSKNKKAISKFYFRGVIVCKRFEIRPE